MAGDVLDDVLDWSGDPIRVTIISVSPKGGSIYGMTPSTSMRNWSRLHWQRSAKTATIVKRGDE